ncbi:hypothetical protein [Streptomyces sp. NPDC002611]
MAMNVVGLLGWISAWVGLLAILVVFLSPGFIPLLLPFMMIAFYRAFIQIFYFPWAMRMRRILQQYPWQVLSGVPKGLRQHPDARDNGPWFEFRDPENPEKKIPLVFLKTMRRYWWTKRIGGPRTKPELKTQIEPLWFAGDPRFLGVIAASSRDDSAPKRMYVLYQRPALDKRVVPLSWEAGAAEIERARRAGARVPVA